MREALPEMEESWETFSAGLVRREEMPKRERDKNFFRNHYYYGDHNSNSVVLAVISALLLVQKMISGIIVGSD